MLHLFGVFVKHSANIQTISEITKFLSEKFTW